MSERRVSGGCEEMSCSKKAKHPECRNRAAFGAASGGTGMKWRCTVCGYIHEGEEPPEICPVCGAPRDAFVRIDEPGEAARRGEPGEVVVSGGDLGSALGCLTYGLFVVSSQAEGRFNGQTCNTVIQITSEPPQVVFALNKRNLTHDYVLRSRKATVTVLGKGTIGLAKHFGFRSGREVDKFEGIRHFASPKLKLPVLTEGVAYLECEVKTVLDAGTHTLFMSEVVDGGRVREREPITYEHYRKNRAKPLADEVDLVNVITSLNLEYGANRRYAYQVEELQNPRLTSVLRGVMKTEGDHVSSALNYLGSRLSSGYGGFSTAIMHMKLNLEFEEAARDVYAQFARETADENLRKMFLEQSRSEAGHVNIFKGLIEEMEQGRYPVVFHCPVCGWEVDFGLSAAEGDKVQCSKCGKKVRLFMVRGDWAVRVDDDE